MDPFSNSMSMGGRLTASLHLKIDTWWSFPFGIRPIFQGPWLLVSGSVMADVFQRVGVSLLMLVYWKGLFLFKKISLSTLSLLPGGTMEWPNCPLQHDENHHWGQWCCATSSMWFSTTHATAFWWFMFLDGKTVDPWGFPKPWIPPF